MTYKSQTEKRYNHIRQWLRIRLAVMVLFRKPVLNLLCLSIITITTVLVLHVKKIILYHLNVSGMLYSAYDCVTNFLAILFLILLILGMLTFIAERSSMVEEYLWDIFAQKKLKYYPILIDYYKEKDKTVFYKFYSWIPYKVWLQKEGEFSTIFGGFVEMKYIGKHKIILKVTTKERIYDDKFIGIDAFGYPQAKIIEEAFQQLLEQFQIYYFKQYIKSENHWIYYFCVGAFKPDIDDEVERLIYLNELAEAVVQRFLHKTKPWVEEMPNMSTVSLLGDELRVFVAKNKHGMLENIESFERRRLLLRQDTTSKKQVFIDDQLNKELQEMVNHEQNDNQAWDGD